MTKRQVDMQCGTHSSKSNAFTSLMKVLNDAENSNQTVAFYGNDQNEIFHTGKDISERRNIHTEKELVDDSSYYKQGMTKFSSTHASLQTKIKQMKKNCDSKNTNIKDIQIKIQAIKLQQQIESQKIAEAWGNRIKAQILESNKVRFNEILTHPNTTAQHVGGWCSHFQGKRRFRRSNLYSEKRL